MKILELTRSFYPSVGGLEKFVSDRLKIYKKLGIEHKLVSTNFSSTKLDTSLAFENPIILKQFTPYNITPGLKKYLDSDYDVLSVNLLGRYYSDLAILYAKRKKKKIILTPHFTFHTHNFNLVKKLHSHLLAPYLLNSIDKIICFTQVEKKFWVNNFDVNNQKIEVIPHYIENPFTNNLELNSVPEKFLLYLGRYDRNKRIDLLLKAFTKVKELNLSLYLTISEKDLNKSLNQIVSKDHRIKLLGYISEEEKWRYINYCEALIFPSDYEAFGSVLLEVSVRNKPILCSSILVFQEILDPGGVIYFDNTVESISSAIKHFKDLDMEKKRDMGRNNFNNLKKFTFENALEKYNELFIDLCKSSLHT